jgi:hypothetical protein
VRALFVRPYDNLERMPCFNVRGIERADDLYRTDRAKRAVIRPAVRYRIEMRAEQQHRQLDRALTPAKHVAGRIDAHREPRLLHEADRVGVRIELGLREPEPGDAAGGIAPDLGQMLEVRLQPSRIDVRRRVDLPFNGGC